MTVPVSTVVQSTNSESSVSAVSWGPIIAGAVVASAVTLLLTLLGSGLGLSMVSPWSSEGASLATFAVSSAIWLIIMQWVSAALGGYLTGRLRTKWASTHTDEVFFRDTAHGFLSWALATLIVAGMVGATISATANAGLQAASTVVSGAGQAAASVASTAADNGAATYLVDTLFRPADPSASANAPDSTAAEAQAGRILLTSAAAGQISDADRAYLSAVVAARTGVSAEDAQARIDATMKSMQDAKVAAQEAADTARKTGATVALFGALSLLVGAFIASAAAALGGRQRDEEEETFLAVTR